MKKVARSPIFDLLKTTKNSQKRPFSWKKYGTSGDFFKHPNSLYSSNIGMFRWCIALKSHVQRFNIFFDHSIYFARLCHVNPLCKHEYAFLQMKEAPNQKVQEKKPLLIFKNTKKNMCLERIWRKKCFRACRHRPLMFNLYADVDARSMTPSRNTRSYTLRSVPSSPGRSFLAPKELYTWYCPMTIRSAAQHPLFEHTPVLNNNFDH